MPEQERLPLFERLAKSLEEAQAFVRGEGTLHTTCLPGRPPRYRAADVARVRRSLRMSPGSFAQLLNVSTRTVRNWESGLHEPAPPVQRLLQVIEAEPDVVARLA